MYECRIDLLYAVLHRFDFHPLDCIFCDCRRRPLMWPRIDFDFEWRALLVFLTAQGHGFGEVEIFIAEGGIIGEVGVGGRGLVIHHGIASAIGDDAGYGTGGAVEGEKSSRARAAREPCRIDPVAVDGEAAMRVYPD